jgi:hypothetical protein
LAASKVELLIGVSVSEEATATHKPKVESLLSGLAGLCAGMEDTTEQHGIDGVAVYAAWEADQDDWQNWDEWLVTSSQDK